MLSPPWPETRLTVGKEVKGMKMKWRRIRGIRFPWKFRKRLSLLTANWDTQPVNLDQDAEAQRSYSGRSETCAKIPLRCLCSAQTTTATSTIHGQQQTVWIQPHAPCGPEICLGLPRQEICGFECAVPWHGEA